MSIVSFTEQYLKNLSKLETLSPDRQKFFWEQRHWHPLVQMTWTTLTRSNGEGLITYPDGSKRVYEVPSFQD
jgi:hypothetical protein